MKSGLNKSQIQKQDQFSAGKNCIFQKKLTCRKKWFIHRISKAVTKGQLLKKLNKYFKMWFNYAVILLIEKYNRRKKKVTESHIVCKL